MTIEALPTQRIRTRLLWLDLTRNCQLNCTHCYNESGPKGGHGTMTCQHWIAVLDQAAAYGVENVQFIGGEPTMHPNFRKLVDHALNLEWLVLGFQAVEGRSSTFEADSPDLPAIVRTISRIGELDLPPVACGWAETRWDRFAADAQEADLFSGDALLYTDINPSNLMIGEQTAWAVDWSWPTRGAAFIDPACLVVQLLAAGHSAESAESWAAQCPEWGKANPRAIDAFASANFRMYEEFARREPGAPWLLAMAEAARRWVVHRRA